MSILTINPSPILAISVISRKDKPVIDHRDYDRLASILNYAADDEETKVVVLRGLDGCFCRGGDINEFIDDINKARLISAVTALFRALANFPKPIVACVEGDAIGVGCTILFHCDVVVAAPASRFRVPFVDYGLVPDAATSILAPRRMGHFAAFRFFCLGEELGAEQAERLGVVSSIATENDCHSAALDIAHRLARKPNDALQQTRKLLRGDTGDLCERIDEEIDLFRRALECASTQKRLRRLSRMAG